MFNFIKQHRVLCAVIALNMIAILVVVFVIVIHNAKTATIDVYVAPSGASIELNGKKYDNFASYNVMPGDYHVKISMEGMQTKEYDIALENDGFIRVWDYLLDENGGFDYYLKNPDEESILAKVATDGEAKKFVENYERVASILDVLPIKYDSYTPDFSHYTQYNIEQDMRDDCPKIICLKIVDRTGGNEQAAKDKIVEEGYDLNDYDISYEYIPLQSVRVGDE